MTIFLIVDFVIITLLIATIVYAFLLNRKLTILHAGKEELKHFLETFAESLNQAKIGVEYLKQVSLNSSKELQDKIRQAKATHDDLGFFLEKGDKTLTQLEKSLQVSQTVLEKLKSTSSTPSLKTSSVSPISSHTVPITGSSSSPSPGILKSVPKNPTKVEPQLIQALRGLR